MILQEKLNQIATVFGATTGGKSTIRCTGKWRGTTDYSIVFDNGEKLFLGNSSHGKRFPQLVDETYELYNLSAVTATKKYALERLTARAPQDTVIAEVLGFVPYEVVSVELITSDKFGYIGWYYIVLKIGNKLVNHLDTNLDYCIRKQTFSESVKKGYYVAGGLKDNEADYVFNGVGFSTESTLYKPRKESTFYKMLYSEVA